MTEEKNYCTFAVTGTTPAFQAIYICNTCSEKNICSGQDEYNENGQVMPLCICQNCAEHCHESQGHDVDYYGSGPCYCDCYSFHQDVITQARKKGSELLGCGCVLQERSDIAAKQLGIQTSQIEGDEYEYGYGYGVNYTLKEKPPTAVDEDINAFPFFCETFTIPSLCAIPNQTMSAEMHPSDTLIDQALELIQHSTDTHWIPHDFNCNADKGHDKESLSELELLAYSIFQRHIDAYNLRDKLGSNGGAEWWVQVKKTEQGHDNHGPQKEAIDLHYDKDEELAEAFDLASFPTLSTVTYLSANILENDSGDTVCASPTLVFPHTYDMPGEGPIGTNSEETEECVTKSMTSSPQVVMSHARVGKHLVFDGRLLHGAPSNKWLRQNTDTIGRDGELSSAHKGIRVTFLVNIWLTRRPSKVIMLPAEIRRQIMDRANGDLKDNHFDLLQMTRRDTTNVMVHDKKGSTIERIHLPFISSGATWIDTEDGNEEDSEVESGLVVKMIPPEQSTGDSVFVTYDTGLEPLLEYVGDDTSSIDDEESS